MTTVGDYLPLFDPRAAAPVFDPGRILRRGDHAPPGDYVYDEDGRIVLAVNVALSTGRPLLVRGKPGSGKSSLAADVAMRLGWRFYEFTITSRTQARDLLWSFDAVRRLSDASDKSGRAVGNQLAYMTPGVLWWAFSPETAARRGQPAEPGDDGNLLEDPSPTGGERAVVLLDEIDKADPDVPNDLLVPLGALRFEVRDIEAGPAITAQAPPLVLITTNEERDLPRAFLRRCVVLTLPEPGPERMTRIARSHFPNIGQDLLDRLLAEYELIKEKRRPDEYEPSLAEYLDAVAAVAALRLRDGPAAQWAELIELTMRKTQAPEL